MPIVVLLGLKHIVTIVLPPKSNLPAVFFVVCNAVDRLIAEFQFSTCPSNSLNIDFDPSFVCQLALETLTLIVISTIGFDIMLK